MTAETIREPAQEMDIRYLKGVGPKKAVVLEKFGIRTVSDLLFFFPRRYEDRSQIRIISEVQPNESVTIFGEVLKVRLKPLKRLSILEMVIGDESGTIHAVWFNQPFLKKQFREGMQIVLFGKVEWYQNRFQLNSPEHEVVDGDRSSVHTGRITPIYPLSEGLYQRSLRSTIKLAVENHLERFVVDYYPESFLKAKGLMGLRKAVYQMHYPESFEVQFVARKRIVFDEFLVFQLFLFQRLERMRNKFQAYGVEPAQGWFEEFRKKLPFELTGSQLQVVADIAVNLREKTPMNRLLQGDVGSGKTVVAACALLAVVKSKQQGVLLVPTEILAEQHFQSFKKLYEGFDVNVELLTSSTDSKKREKMVAMLKQGKVDVVIGTHAVLQDDVQFQKLALVVIDEQHKFGVYQRCRLLQQQIRPHQLVMTATPIPRTLALTIYGDLKISTMKDMPQGRKPIETFWMKREKQKEVLEHIREKVKGGEQAYFIFPLIDETEKLDLLAATQEFDQLKKTVFKGLGMGLVHGRMSKEERDHMMGQFRTGKIQILVATSVIEVGVDNPKATMMVVENAERFGLAQLHQLRGRIGRGNLASECYLFGEPKTDEGKRRLRVMTKTQDGFLIAEEDLKLRGPGDFMGTRQSGEPYFRVGHPLLDEDILVEARKTAKELMESGFLRNSPEWRPFKTYLEKISIQY